MRQCHVSSWGFHSWVWGSFPFFPPCCLAVCGSLKLRPGRDRAVTILSLQEAIMEPLDHKNLDKDVPYFSEVVRWVTEGLEP